MTSSIHALLPLRSLRAYRPCDGGRRRAGRAGGVLWATVACALAPALWLASPAPAAAQDVRIYRCTDAAGRVAIGNVPCAEGQREEARTMVRPRDGAAPPVAPAAPTAAAADPDPPTRVIVVRPPQPLYECVRPDGSVYDSASAEGDPRWVPLWTLGYPVHGGVGRRVDAGRGGAIAPGTGRPGLSVPPRAGLSVPVGSPPRAGDLAPQRAASGGGDRDRRGHGGYYGGGGAGGTWVRDACSPLPQGEVCDRLVDRRDDLRRRFFNAQQSERDALRVEERGLNARLADDCGIR